MAAPTRAQIVADVTSPTFAVEAYSGSAWVDVSSYVVTCTARLEASGGEPSGIAMGPEVRPEATIELLAAGWVAAGNNTPVRIAFGFATSDKVQRFGGIVTRRRRGAASGTWECRGWDAHIEGQEIRSPLLVYFRRRPIATRTSLTSVDDPTSGVYRGGLINYILWQSGGRPAEQSASYPSATFYYRCSTALIAPEYTWIAGDNPWEVLRRLCRGAGGQIYQDGDGVVTYVDPITLASGTPAFTFTDEVLTAGERATQGKAGYEDIEAEYDAERAVTGVTCAYTSRMVQGEQVVYEDSVPRQIAAGDTITVVCDTQLPLYSVRGAAVDAAIVRTAVAATSLITVGVTGSTAQRVTVALTNTASEAVMVDRLRVTGRPVSAGEPGSASYIASAGRVVTIEDSPYVQSERHAAMLCRMLYDAEAAGGVVYRLSGCAYDPDRAVGEVVGLTSSDLGLSAERCRIVRIDTDGGAWMEVELAPLGSLPTLDSVWRLGYITSDTKALAY